MKTILLKFFMCCVGLFAGFLFILPTASLAQTTIDSSPQRTIDDSSQRTIEPGNEPLFDNPLNAESFCLLLKDIFDVLVLFAIPIAVVFVVYAGFKFVFARGNPDGLTSARKNMMWTLVGIALFFGAWFLARVIANTLIALGGSPFNTCI